MTTPVQHDIAQPATPIKPACLWRRYLPLVIWMVLIFIGSTALLTPNHTGSLLQSLLAVFSIHLDRVTADHVNHIVRKCGHVCEYSILALLAARVFLTSSRAGLSRWWWACSLAVVIAFASTDEYHQTFVAGREGQVKDVLLDTAGGAAALTFFAIARAIWMSSRKKAADIEPN
jgi:VanZ family protein